MADVKDILGVPRAGPGPAAQEEVKEKKEKVKRPQGMSREAFALLDSSHPVAPSQLVDTFKKKKDAKTKPKASTKGTVTFQWKSFHNPARTDKLELFHWVKGYKDITGRVRDADESEYQFAKYNKKVSIFRYDDEEWDNLLKHDGSGWSREESDYLLDLCEQYQLRFIVMADRYEFAGSSRSVEDLKDRYYSICRRLLVAREGGEAAVCNQLMIKYPYNAQHERDRKRAFHTLLTRSFAQEAQENSLLEEAKKIEDKRRAAEAALAALNPPPPPAPVAAAAQPQMHRQPSTPAGTPMMMTAPAHRTHFPHTFPADPGPGVSTLFDVDVKPLQNPKPGIYVRSTHIKDVATQQASAMVGNSSRAQKSVDSLLQDLGWPQVLAVPRNATRATAGAFLAMRAEAMQLLEMRRLLQNRQMAEAGAERSKRSDKRKR